MQFFFSLSATSGEINTIVAGCKLHSLLIMIYFLLLEYGFFLTITLYVQREV